jgi:hypothetical protein
VTLELLELQIYLYTSQAKEKNCRFKIVRTAYLRQYFLKLKTESVGCWSVLMTLKIQGLSVCKSDTDICFNWLHLEHMAISIFTFNSDLCELAILSIKTE